MNVTEGTSTTLQSLIALSRELGREDRRLAILGEGNTSADNGDGTFWIKASGSQLGTIDESGFSLVRSSTVLDLLEHGEVSDEEVAGGLKASLVNAAHKMPSVEIFLHAVLLSDGGARRVRHAHTTSVNAILCSRQGAEPFMRHRFPDAIVVCGAAPGVLPHVEPGLVLGRVAREELRRYGAEYGRPHKLILMDNHGAV